ncbi:MAG: hypothetical protein CME62_06905 [Halobacteriovoraceae bacterium]|nr:hypothetical protein [Halobacteriovoraceae bacterium]|tara:strand:- start:16392 stop:18056 length:1665 start_codon:yes stop_codon:yes gene_type:complete
MMKHMILIFVLTLSLSASAATEKQKKMIKFIDAIAGVYDSMYAPALWKKEFANWTLAANVQTAKEQVLTEELTNSNFHKIINELILSMKDYHVSAKFYATEKATLPFTIRGTDGRYFFVYIDRSKLPVAEFPFQLGDELVMLDEMSVDEIVQEIKAGFGENTDETDQALAEMYVTSRKADKAIDVPSGPVQLTIKTRAGVTKKHQLIWDYTPEQILRKNLSKKLNNVLAQKNTFDLQMTTQLAEDLMSDVNADNRFGIGARQSYLPELGTKIWSSDKENHFDAYIYMNDAKELVGYIRIPKYGAGEKESKLFKEIIKKFQKTTDKLVIDQLNNPGGSVFYLYSLVSMLADKAMFTPKHYMAINQKMISEHITNLEQLEKVTNLEQLKKVMGGDTVSGYPISMTFLSFMKAYYQFTINEWNAGKTLTTPYHLYGVDMINPHPEVNYTKPILLLVNELDFSGGDFFPAIMQDNKRATIMGVRTAGAGGYVLGVEIPNQFGVGTFRYTGSLADRVDNTPIENLGVKPDIAYPLTVKDFQTNFKPFKDAINNQVKKLK